MLVYPSEKYLDFVQEIYDRLLSGYHKRYTTPRMLQVFARGISCALHDMPPIWTGYMSRAAIVEVCNGNIQVGNLTNEHFSSRQRSAREIIQYFSQHNPTFNQFLTYTIKHCLVHKVLPFENHNLVKYQRQHADWKDAYYYAGIELIKIHMEGTKRCTQARVRNHRFNEPTDYSVIEQELQSSFPTEAI